MPVTKPNLITSAASLHGVKRARDGAANRSMAQNAALGLDNFSRLLQQSPESAQNFVPKGMSAQDFNNTSQGAGVDILKASGLDAAQSFVPGSNLRNMTAIQRAMQNSAQPLATARGLSASEAALPGNSDAATLVLPRSSDAAVLALRTAANKTKAAVEKVAEVVTGSMGKLSSLFESGRDGLAAIGYDKVGGTSYGTYQIASNTGTFGEFLKYLDKHAPAYSKELRQAGEANTGSKQGAVPDAWRGIAQREPEAWDKLQHDFIEEKLYNVAAGRLAEQGIDESKLSPTMREVLFSTAVQHGGSGAARIVGRAMEDADVKALMAPDGTPGVDKSKTEEQVIKRIYDIRQTQFSSSTPRVQNAVQNRLNSEMQMALTMLKTGDLA